MINIAVIEDNPETTKQIQGYIERYFESKTEERYKISAFASSETFLEHSPGNYDLIFMDIKLPGTDGMTAAEKLRQTGYKTPLIFITSLAQYAVHGYDVDALDFIVKPVSYYQFSMKMDKAFRNISRRRTVNITITVDRCPRIISSGDLYYVETSRHDLIFHTANGKYRCRGTLNAVEKQLSDAHFLRINVCYLINMDYVIGLDNNSITIENGDELFISRARRKTVFTTLVEYIGGSV